ALVIDAIIIGLVTSPLARTVEIGPNHVSVGYNPAAVPAQFLYAWLMIGLVNGQTLGAMALGVRVMRTNGDRVDIGRSAARAAMAIVSGLVLGLGYLWAAWDVEKRTWHDMVADTRVYRTKPG
ncbi:MAG TPA: RDD family protein, partial [Actinomycetota bacterium]|nr:RDD family protein [Actinomycetota bacterium]